MTNNEIIFENVRASFTPAQLAELVQATYTAEQIAARRSNVSITVDEGSAATAEDIFTAMLAADQFHTFAEWKRMGYSVKKGAKSAITCQLWKYTDKPGKAAREAAEAASKLTADFADTCQRCPWVKHPIPDYELTSLRGKIKRTQARLDELDKRTEQAQQPAESTKFSGGEIVRNLEADRLQIIFDEKPDDEQREALKQNGFRWSPRYGAWQRQLTRNAEIAARRALGLTE